MRRIVAAYEGRDHDVAVEEAKKHRNVDVDECRVSYVLEFR